MPDPVVTREPPRYDEVYTGGTFMGIQMTVVAKINDASITVQTTWNLPDDEQLTAEQWHAQKQAIGPSFAARAALNTNLEYQVLQTIMSHIAALPQTA
jgi:hypothetical protein